MTTQRLHYLRRSVVIAVAVGGLAACGGAGSEPGTSGAAAPDAASGAAYGDLLGALDRVKVPTCQPAEAEARGAGFIALPAPAAEAARDHSWFRYREGRIYEFGPCQLASGKRNELRIFRYADTAARDLALREIARRGTRPTSTFAYLDVHAVEIWSPEPSLDSPVGQLAAQVHSAIGALPQAWHPDLEGGA
ncbi:MAG: hypothetical protein ACRD2W_17230 [Acidimicrobiales bacterium]